MIKGLAELGSDAEKWIAGVAKRLTWLGIVWIGSGAV